MGKINYSLKPELKEKVEEYIKKNPALEDFSVKIQRNKSLLYSSMIDAYYETSSESRFNKIYSNAIYLFCTLRDKELLETCEALLENEYISYMFASFNFDANEYVESLDVKCQEEISKLVVLSSVKFKKEDNYSDTAKTEMEYLRYDYIKEIDDIIDSMEDFMYSYAFSKVALDYCEPEDNDKE